MVLLYRNTKTILVIQLTVPWEDRLANSHQLKSTKYQDLNFDIRVKGQHTILFHIEVGCCGFPATSVRYFFWRVSLEPTFLKKATREIAMSVETSWSRCG